MNRRSCPQPTPLMAQPRPQPLSRTARILAAALALQVAATPLLPWLPMLEAEADAQEATKAVLGLIPFSRKNGAGAVAAARLEEYLRQMLEAGGSVKVIPAKVLASGKATDADLGLSTPAAETASPAQKSLDKADKLAITARDMLAEGTEVADALTLLENAAKRYEDNFVELVDFTKLVDVYAMAAQAALAMGNEKASRGWLTKALTIQMTFVVDGRKANKDLARILTELRAQLEPKATGELSIEATPADAEIFVDGVRVGSGTATVQQLLPGTHYVQLRKEGAPPWGQAVVLKGKPVKVAGRVVMPVAAEDQIAITVTAEDARQFAETGVFHERLFKNTAGLFAKQVRASHLLYGTVSRSAKTVDLHLFLFNAKLKKTCALDPVAYSLNLTNLQMQTLDAEGAVRAALTGTCKEVTALPEVFETAPAPVEPEAPRPEIVPTPEETRPEPKRESVVVRPSEPVREEPRRPEPVRDEPRRDSTDPYAGLLEPEPEERDTTPMYKKWWFWTGVGLIAAAGAGAGVWALTRPEPEITGFQVKVRLP